MDRSDKCPACGTTGLALFFESRAVPVLVNILHPTRERALRCARGDIALGFCGRCGFIGNLAFDPSKLVYVEGYENPLHHSEVFRAYSQRLALDLVERFDLRGKNLVEIGCGDGEFLRRLCDLGENRGVGFDPSYPTTLPAQQERYEVVRDSFSEQYAGVEMDFVFSRHTLEHIQDPKSLLGLIRRSIRGRTTVPIYLEVPNASYTLRNCFVWDIIYEHPSYFTQRSLAGVLKMSGFDVERVYDTFSGQYLCGEARVAPRGEPEDRGFTISDADAKGVRDEVQVFASSYDQYVDRWRNELEKLRAAGKRCAVWGAGSKGITFLNTFDVIDVFDCVVDANPRKHGMFAAGSGHPIVGPEHLRRARPDAVIVANPVYRTEVEGILAGMGLAPEVATL